MNIRKIADKKFYNIGRWDQCYKTFYTHNLRKFKIKLECLPLVSLSILVYCLWDKLWAGKACQG
jgi:hypothetical protein